MNRRKTLIAAGVTTTLATAVVATPLTAQAKPGAPGRARVAAVTCSGPEQSRTIAHTGGSVVAHGGHAWITKWWTHGDVPGRNGPGVWVDGGACSGTRPAPSPALPAPPQTAPFPIGPPPITRPPIMRPPIMRPPIMRPPSMGTKVIGYFTEWGVYERNYHVKNVQTSGSAGLLTHLVYAFGNVTNGQCAIGDSYADYDKVYTAADSVDGVADSGDTGALRGNFGQLRRLKRLHPNLKVLWSFGGWTWSGGFSQAVENPTAFANSCHDLVEDPRWADVFDGIDIDWEYPNACGLSCDTSGRNGYTNLMAALRSRFGQGALVTSAITADGTAGGKIDAVDYAGAAEHVDWFMAMTFDYAGAFNPQGPTAPHSPLRSYPGQPIAGFDSATTINKLKATGIPANKILLGIGFYGRGWTGVTQDTPGGMATQAAPGTHEPGVEDYKALKTRCPATGTVGGTAYARCGSQWWSYDTPQTIAGKMAYVKWQRLGGAFFWELSGDTCDGELIKAMALKLNRPDAAPVPGPVVAGQTPHRPRFSFPGGSASR
jgi:chitinase